MLVTVRSRRASGWVRVGRARAVSDLLAIGDYIARDKPGAARQRVEQLRYEAALAAEMPSSGRVVPECRRDDNQSPDGVWSVNAPHKCANTPGQTLLENKIRMDELRVVIRDDRVEQRLIAIVLLGRDADHRPDRERTQSIGYRQCALG